MKHIAIILGVIVALVISGSASAQWVDPSGTGLSLPIHPTVAVTLVPQLSTPTFRIVRGQRVVSEIPTDNRPDVPDPPTGLGRSSVPCGGARRLCPGKSPIPVPRPPVPPLVTLTTQLVIDNSKCYIKFTANLPGFVNGEFVNFGVRPFASTDNFINAYATFTFSGNATIVAPASQSSGEWQVNWGGEKSNIEIVSSALPIICGG